MTPVSTSQFSALLGTQAIRLLGRDQLIAKIKDQVKSSQKSAHPTLIYLQGPGGIGKTYLLQTLRAQFAAEGRIDWLISDGLVDLYHLDYQTPFGLAQAIANTFPNHVFQNFRAAMRKRDQALQAHNPAQAEALEAEAVQQWLKDLNRVSSRHPVLIFLDTLERFAALKKLESSAENWLIDILPQLKGKVVVFAAGRPQDVFGNPNTFLENLPVQDNFTLKVYTLSPLSAQHAEDYLQHVAQEVEEIDPRGARHLRRLLEKKTPEEIHRITGGHPLHLALVADMLRVTGNLPDNVSPDSFDWQAADHLVNADYPVSRALMWLAYLPKGGNAALLSSLMKISEEKAQNILNYLKTLAIVKYRGAGYARPYFLHDELYRIFREHVPLPEESLASWYETVQQYYDVQINAIERQLTTKQYGFLIQQRWNLRVEKLHYQIWMDPEQAFSDYYVLRNDAFSSGSKGYMRAILNETWHTLQEKPADQVRPAWQHVRDDRDAMRIEELGLSRREYQPALDKLEQTTFRTGFYTSLHKPLLQGILATKQGDFETAKNRLNQVLQNLEKISQTTNAHRAIRANAHNYLGYIARQEDRIYPAMEHYHRAMAEYRWLETDSASGVLINLAYAEKMAEHNRAAYGHIEEALLRAERSDNPYLLARVYNVLSVLHLMDKRYAEAQQAAETALEYIRQNPNPIMEGWIRLNLGRIQRYRWNEKAEARQRAAWKDFLPEALYYVGTSDDREKIIRISRDDQAWRWSRKFKDHPGALELFAGKENKLGVLETNNELGSLWREVAWALYKTKGEPRHRQAASDTAEHYFLKAAGIPYHSRRDVQAWRPALEEHIQNLPSPFWPLWALTNLGWHWYYQKTRRKDRTEEDVRILQKRIHDLATLIYAHIPVAYRLDFADGAYRSAPEIEKFKANLMLWKVLAKLEMLLSRTHLAQAARQTARDYAENTLQNAVHHWLRSLEYNKILGDNSYDLHRAERNIFSRITETPNYRRDFLPAIYHHTLEIEKLYGFGAKRWSTLRTFLYDRFGPQDVWVLRK